MINSFKQYIVEEDKTLYFTFGRMNPPTIGHGKLLEVLSAKSQKNPYRVYLSQTNDKKKNPLTYVDKIKAARKMFSKHSRFIILDKNIKTIFDVANAVYNEGFVNVVMVVGSDRVVEFKTLITKYNGMKGQRYGFYNFRSIEVISAGERDPDSEGVEGMSASKMRAAASDNDFNQFTKGLPKNFSNKDSKDLFNAVRSGMGLKEQTEFYKHVQLESVSDIREKYVAGEIYKIGERVKIRDTEEIVEISFRGPNYLILEKEDGTTIRKWIDSVETIDEETFKESLWANIHKKRKEGRPMRKPGSKGAPSAQDFKNARDEEVTKEEKNPRIPRKDGQPANSKKHSDLYTDENPKGTIHGLKFATIDDAKASVNKIKSSNRTHAHKIQAAVAMEQRAKVAGKISASRVYREYINDMKKKTKEKNESVNTELDNFNKMGFGSPESTKAWIKATPGQTEMANRKKVSINNALNVRKKVKVLLKGSK